MIRKYKVNVDNTSYEVSIESLGYGTSSAPAPVYAPAAPVAPVAQTAPAATPAPAAATPPSAAPAAAGAGSVTAPLSGVVQSIKVSAGQTVKEGDLLLIMEAMKMETEIFAPAGGTIASVNTSPGTSVNAGDLLCVIN